MGAFDVGQDGSLFCWVDGKWIPADEAQEIANQNVHVLSVKYLGTGDVDDDDGNISNGFYANIIVRVGHHWIESSVTLIEDPCSHKLVAWHDLATWMGSELLDAVTEQKEQDEDFDIPKLSYEIVAAVNAHG